METAYAAGIMDGEGMIRLFRRNRRNGFELQTAIIISNTHAELIRAIQSEFGGVLSQRQNKHRPILVLTWGKKSEARAFLTAIFPHLIVKRVQAAAMLEFLERHDESRRVRYDEKDLQLLDIISKANAESRWRSTRDD